MMVLDHIAVGAGDLAAGCDHVERALGIRPGPGGQHPHFGTHNRLLGLAQGLYFEVIAIDPEAPAPGRARWFDLDRFAGPPRLTNWIMRVPDLDAALARFPEAGRAVDLARGDFRWRMAVPDDGRLPYDNCFPALIEWQGAAHPAQRLPEAGLGLRELVVRHPEAQALAAWLTPALNDARLRFEVGEAGLCAAFDTPAGPRVLS